MFAYPNGRAEDYEEGIIRILVERDLVTLRYRLRERGGEWQPTSSPSYKVSRRSGKQTWYTSK